MRISDWSSDVCSSDLILPGQADMPDNITSTTPIQRACNLVGGQSALARKLLKTDGEPLTSQAVSYWCAKNRVPAEWVVAIEAATDGRVTRQQLRPDLYPDSAAA